MTDTTTTAHHQPPAHPPPRAARQPEQHGAMPGYRGRLLELVRRRPLTAFFVLAFGISWLAWLPYVASASGLGLVDLQFPSVLGTTQLFGVLPGAYLGPLTAALVVTSVAEGRAGLRAWRRRLTNWRVGWRWYVGVLTAVPAVTLLATLLLPGAWSGAQLVGIAVLAAYLPVLALQIITTGVAEEPGWRDFALPRLQARRGPVLGTVILGTLWGCWHLPLFLTDWGGWPDLTWVDPAEFVLLCIPLSIVITWVYNRTGGSLPLIILLHSSINTVFSSVWPAVFPTLDWSRDPAHVLLLAATAAAALLLIATRGRLGLPSGSGPAAQQTMTSGAERLEQRRHPTTNS